MPANVESMFYVGETPWHKIGTHLSRPPDTKTAIIKAGLDWKVEKISLYDKEQRPIQNYYGIMRKDNKKVLGVVKKGYEPLQNIDAFQFFDPLINNKYIEYETAGSLEEGEVIWILARIKDNPIAIKKADIVNKYLLLSNSHNGESAVSIKFTPIRVVCQNTLNIALSKGQAMRIKHLTSMKNRLTEVQEHLNNIFQIYHDIEQKFHMMAETRMDSESVNEYFNTVFPISEPVSNASKEWVAKREATLKVHNTLKQLYINGMGVKEYDIAGTLWAAYNAVTQFIDHPQTYRFNESKLLKRIWFGEGESIKKKAY